MKKHIPNFITSLNLFSGCVGIIAVLTSEINMGAYMIALAAVFDFLDGLTARILHVKSEIGKQLDSLADVVSFGVLPGMIVFQLMQQSESIPQLGAQHNLMAYFALIIPVFSAIRLAKFNIDTRQTTSFIGVPTPANALLFGSLPLILSFPSNSFIGEFLVLAAENYFVLLLMAITMSLLLIAELPLFALKFSNLKISENKPQFILVLLSVVLFGFLFVTAIPLIILGYIVLSLVFRKK